MRLHNQSYSCWQEGTSPLTGHQIESCKEHELFELFLEMLVGPCTQRFQFCRLIFDDLKTIYVLCYVYIDGNFRENLNIFSIIVMSNYADLMTITLGNQNLNII